LAEERAARERLEAELVAAREQIAALSAHHDSAVERSNEVVRLEGELAAAIARAEEAERGQAPVEVAPLPPRVPRRRAVQDWGAGARAAAVATVVLLLLLFALILARIF
jgi:hypothetical protein